MIDLNLLRRTQERQPVVILLLLGYAQGAVAIDVQKSGITFADVVLPDGIRIPFKNRACCIGMASDRLVPKARVLHACVVVGIRPGVIVDGPRICAPVNRDPLITRGACEVLIANARHTPSLDIRIPDNLSGRMRNRRTIRRNADRAVQAWRLKRFIVWLIALISIFAAVVIYGVVEVSSAVANAAITTCRQARIEETGNANPAILARVARTSVSEQFTSVTGPFIWTGAVERQFPGSGCVGFVECEAYTLVHARLTHTRVICHEFVTAGRFISAIKAVVIRFDHVSRPASHSSGARCASALGTASREDKRIITKPIVIGASHGRADVGISLIEIISTGDRAERGDRCDRVISCSGISYSGPRRGVHC